MPFAFSVSARLRGAIVCLLALAVAPLNAQEASPERDALIVETLLRLENFDLDAKPKTKEAVLRYLKANPGSEQFFQLIERFKIQEAADDLLELAATQPNETAGAKSAELLLKLEAVDSIDKTIAGEDTARAAALIQALGNVGGNQVIDKLSPLVTDDDQPLAIRSSAASALGKSKPGIELLLALTKEKKLAEDLNFTVANVLFAAPDPAVQAEAKKYLKLPASANEKPLPPLPELMKMSGNVEQGKKLFASTATCNKCHVVRGEGKEVGPNLSEIGSKLSKEAFLVSILDPSAGISHNYETFVATTDEGKVISGLLVSKSDEQVVLRDANAIDHTLKAESVEELAKIPISLMPADLQRTMTAQDLIDVVEYLMTLKKS